MTPALTGLAQETVAPDEAGRDAGVHRVSEGRQPSDGTDRSLSAGSIRAVPQRVRRPSSRSPTTCQRRFASACSRSPGRFAPTFDLRTPRPRPIARRTCAACRSRSSTSRGRISPPGLRRQDFVLNSHPVMVARDSTEFLALLKADGAGWAARWLFFAPHPALARSAWPRNSIRRATSTFRTGARPRTSSAPAAP